MDFYLTQNGIRRGPLRVFQVKDMLDRGEASPADLGWHSGLAGWLPLREIDAITPYLPPTTPAPTTAGAEEPEAETAGGDDEAPAENQPHSSV